VEKILEKLKGGDRRSIGRANEVAGQVLARPSLFEAIVSGMLDEDPLVRMRSADAAEKVTAQRPELLQPYKGQLLRIIARYPEKDIRWHVAQMLPRLKLTKDERDAGVKLMREYLKDESSIVRTFSMQALADFASQDRELLPQVLPLIETLTRTGTPAMASRGRRLLKKLRRLAS
jgi:HEAT repeat protein